ncbi:MAG: CinA family nicotinamide mononucleotide deamidase-related protein [Saprospiraceae bacterium]|nr:CinA family nicotinamide mononucleotide deamidase-related protein [Saprospiraceae bacterium]
MNNNKISIVTIGHEILIGQIVDTNSAWLGEKLTETGMSPYSIISIADDEQQIIETLQSLSQTHDMVLMTGGLGPTKDDITVRSIAKFLDVPLVFFEEVYERIVHIFQKLNRPLSDSTKAQCFLPEGVEILHNSMGTAPGMLFRKDGFTLISMPGVPYEMKAIYLESVLEKVILPLIQKNIIQKTLLIAGKGETEIEDLLEPVISTLPSGYSVAYLPGLGQVRVRLTAVSDYKNGELSAEFEHYISLFENILGNSIFGTGDTNLEKVLGQLCVSHQLKIGTVESCTGGNVAARLASVPGASEYFTGGLVAYTNDIKKNIVGVSDHTLEIYGAVSEETVKEMVNGGLRILGSDIVISISGIAGPTGGSEEKPVGTIWLAVGNKNHTETKKLNLGKKREQNILLSAQAALNMLRLFILRYY